MWLAVAVFVALSLPIGLHPDDVAVVKALPSASWGEVWTSPFKGLFYRPVTVSLTKLSTDVFGATAWPLRLLQGGLIAATIALFAATVRRTTSEVARGVGMLCLLASPMTFVSMTPFAVGVSDTIVAICFIACVRGLRDEELSRRRVLAVAALSAIAVLAKESGVLVPVYVAILCGLRRQWTSASVMAAAAALYVALRSTMVQAHDVAFSTGFVTELLSPAQLTERFGGAYHWLYAYNVVCNLSTALIYIPERGYFRWTGLTLVAALVFALTTAIWLRHVVSSGTPRRYVALMAVIPVNAILGYTYVRTRVMFVAYVAVALLFTPAVDDLWRRQQRILGVSGRALAICAIVGWVVVLVTSLARLTIQVG
jgi:hypothetical protein